MTTYAETKGCAPFDWNKALEDAIAMPPSYDQWMEMVSLAKEWVTCACGNLCAALPREFNGAPEDYTLDHLGRQFSTSVTNRQWPAAKQILEEIEACGAELPFLPSPIGRTTEAIATVYWPHFFNQNNQL